MVPFYGEMAGLKTIKLLLSHLAGNLPRTQLLKIRVNDHKKGSGQIWPLGPTLRNSSAFLRGVLFFERIAAKRCLAISVPGHMPLPCLCLSSSSFPFLSKPGAQSRLYILNFPFFLLLRLPQLNPPPSSSSFRPMDSSRMTTRRADNSRTTS